MKNLRAFTFIYALSLFDVTGQCLERVFYLSGTQSINGTDVSVFSSGNTYYDTTYCISTYPYRIGYNFISGTADGEYTFIFSPPVDSVTLNFSAVTNMPPAGAELVKLKVNGVHYVIPNVGTSNGCEPLAELTASGDITTCSGCNLTGWNSTTINGPVTSLTVLDTVLYGSPAGVLFSLFICTGSQASVEKNESNKNSHYDLFPNPFSDKTILKYSKEQNPLTLTLFNANGQIVRSIRNIISDQVIISREQLKQGLYYFVLRTEDKVKAAGRMVIE